mmetsp:Transcript_25586/g.67038  ORF Transcript_25586/g.67038 Transcript_25586/m.67038 type:complete len:343 (-) Transcript_25586:164-1192(-)
MWKRVIDSAAATAAGGPGRRSSLGVSVVSHTAYLFGGEYEARVPVDNAVFAAPITGGEWCEVKVPEMPRPVPRIAHGQASHPHGFFVFGGRQGIKMDEAPLNDLWFFNPKESAWLELKHEGTPPSERSFHRLVSVYDAAAADPNAVTLFVFGGCGAEGRLADLHKATVDLKVGTATWAQDIAKAPAGCRGRGGPGVAHVATPAPAGSVVVLAGFAGEETSDMYVYDVRSNTWRDVALTGDSFIPRSVFAMTPAGPDSVLVFGGEVGESARGHEGAGDFGADTLLVDLAGKVKSVEPEGPNAPPPRGWAACDRTVDGAMFLTGGLAGNDANPTRLNDSWVGEL